MAARVTVVGSINMDLVVTTERLPGPGETILGSDFQRFGGGKGANQALAAAKMGASVRLIGKVGTDEAGRALVGDLLRAGVDIGRIGRAEGPTGTAVITVDSQGTNTIVVVPAANALLTPADVEAAREVIADSDAVLMQLEVPMETVLAAAEIARAAGVAVFLNPSPGPAVAGRAAGRPGVPGGERDGASGAHRGQRRRVAALREGGAADRADAGRARRAAARRRRARGTSRRSACRAWTRRRRATRSWGRWRRPSQSAASTRRWRRRRRPGRWRRRGWGRSRRCRRWRRSTRSC